MTNAILRGKPDAGNPHVRFDEGEVASAKPRRGSLLYRDMTLGSKGIVGLMTGAIAVVGTLRAGPVAWYRFDGSTDTVVNRANPGVNDAMLMTIGSWGGLSGLKPYDSASPARASAGWPEGTKAMDVKTGTVYDGDVQALGFSGDPAKSGVAIVYKSGNSNFSLLEGLSTFTCEAFVKVPDSGSSHAAKDILFPIVGVGSGSSISSQSQGWSLCLRNNNDGKGFYPFVRIWKKTSSSTELVDLDCSTSPLSGGTWHHVAFVANKKNDSGLGEFRIYLDYKLIRTLSASTYYGIHFNSGSAFPLLIGADLWRVSKSACFAGQVAEVRISNEVLTCNQMLAPIAAAKGPVSANTLAYLPLGENAWFAGADVLSKTETGAAPTWTYGTTSPVAAYPTASADVKGPVVRDGVYTQAATPETGSLTFTRTLNTSGNNFNGHLIHVPCDGLTTQSFTLEFAFKTDGQIATSSGYTSYTFLNPSWAKIMINQADGKLKTRLISESGNWDDWDTSARVDDGRWHHYALVYDKETKSFDVYLDYRRQDFGKATSIELAHSKSSAFDFGCGQSVSAQGQSVSVQGFSGQLDDLRVTRGTLSVADFLVNSAYVGPYPLDAQFEGDFSSGQCAEIAPAGVGAALGSGSVPTFADRIGLVDLLGEGTYARESTKCLSLAGGYVQFPCNHLLEVNEFTVEFFARFTELQDSANLLRFSQGSAISGAPIWTLYYRTNDDVLLLTANYIDASGESKSVMGLEFISDAKPADGRWHHWALVSKANGVGGYTVTLYRDYAPYGKTVTVPGAYAFSVAGSNLSIGGTGVSSAHITGKVNELRFRAGACAPSTFMRYKSTMGAGIILR